MIRPVQNKLYAVIGNPVTHSLSPLMMNAVFTSQRIAAVYLAFQVDALERELPVFAAMGFAGLSVTLPHKETAYRLAQDLDETARAIGAVNTLRWTGELWEGCNTDWLGANRALQQVTSLSGKRVAVIGAGGVARAVVYGLQRAGAQTTIFNRSLDRGQMLAQTFACDFLPLPELHRAGCGREFDIVIQCTSVGMQGKTSGEIVPAAFFQPQMVVLDTVYRPLATPFLQHAQRAGCTVVNGLEMLLYQGAAQLEWWLRHSFRAAEGVSMMRNTLRRALSHEQTDPNH